MPRRLFEDKGRDDFLIGLVAYRLLQFGPRSLTALFGKGILLFGRQADDGPARLFQLLIGGLIGFRDFSGGPRTSFARIF